jgi:hypothetical protein
MVFELEFSEDADNLLKDLEADKSKKEIYKAVGKTLKLMQTNLRHPGLNSHEYSSLTGPKGEKVYEVYVQNKTPGAWRIFYYYGPERGCLTILLISPHPD